MRYLRRYDAIDRCVAEAEHYARRRQRSQLPEKQQYNAS